MAPNPFLQNQFNNQGITPPQFGAGQLQAPGQQLPSYMPMANLNTPNVQGSNPSAQQGGSGLDWSGGIAGGLSGVGNFLTGMANNQMLNNQQQIQGGSNLMSGINQQEQMANNGSQAAMQYVQPQNSVMPFAKMAMARALANGGPSQLQVPSFLQGFTPNIQSGTNWQGIKDAANQYLSDPVIHNSFEQYNKQLLNVDPYAQPMSYASMFPNDPNAQKDQQDMTNWQLQSQGRRANYENNAQQALKQALQAAKDNQPGFWSKLFGGITSGVGAALPFLGL